MPPTRLTLNNWSVDLLPAPSMSALPFSEVLEAVFQQLLWAPRFCFRSRLQSLWPTLFISLAQLSLLCFVQRTSLPVFQHGSSPASSIVFAFSSVVSRVVSSSALDVASSFFLQLQLTQSGSHFGWKASGLQKASSGRS